jgi:hypothetical protein
MFAGLIAGHLLAYRLVYSDAHARADALARSGHAYFGYVPLALSAAGPCLLSRSLFPSPFASSPFRARWASLGATENARRRSLAGRKPSSEGVS